MLLEVVSITYLNNQFFHVFSRSSLLRDGSFCFH
nr:MAG TPA: hypothetical protein [Caudoviricetes sp.]